MRSMILLSSLLFTAPALAGNAHDDAMAALKSGDEAGARKAYKSITRSSPDDARAWFMLGTLELGRGKATRAIGLLQTALDKGWYPAVGAYNLACAHARAGDPDDAFAALDQALAAGYADPAHLAEDADLASLHDLSGWQERLDRAERNKNPCGHDERYRAFDFWVGTWDVFDAKGVKVGENVIRAEQNACLVTEHWSGALGNTGQSMSYLDPADGRWHQDWVASNGGVVHFAGGADAAGAMVLEGTKAGVKGEPKPTRCTWSANGDGTVTQRFEGRGDDGAWTTNAVLTYRPRAAE